MEFVGNRSEPNISAHSYKLTQVCCQPINIHGSIKMIYRSRTSALAPFIAYLIVFTRAATNTAVAVPTDGVRVGDVKDVYFYLIVSSAPTVNTSGVVSQVDKTMELINGDADVVPGCKLQYSRVFDTRVSTI